MLGSWGCSSYTSVAYTRVFTVYYINHYIFSPSVLPCSTWQAIPDDAPHKKSKWFYSNPRHPRTRYYNEILPQIYEAARPHTCMSESSFGSYLFTEREKRWKLKGEFEKLEPNVSYLLSDKNPACFGRYTRPHIHPTPKALNSCKRGIQELSSPRLEIATHWSPMRPKN